MKKDTPLVFDYDYGFLIIRGGVNKKIADYFENKEGIKLKVRLVSIKEKNGNLIHI